MRLQPAHFSESPEGRRVLPETLEPFDLAAFEPTPEEQVFMVAVLGLIADPKGNEDIIAAQKKYENYDPRADFESDAAFGLAMEMARISLMQSPDDFAAFAGDNIDEIETLWYTSPRLVELLAIGYKRGIADKNGACANSLGALYYMGRIANQNYAIAAGLYEAASDWGNYQGLINLGYIYEYGRAGEKDMHKAYDCYAMSAAMTQSSEALYKMGDIYSRGSLGTKDAKRAVRLWEKSLDSARNVREEAQPAIRLAPYYLSSEAEEVGLSIDPFAALVLYQKAEQGLRLAIKDGETYYENRLQEAIKGQELARVNLDFPTFDL